MYCALYSVITNLVNEDFTDSLINEEFQGELMAHDQMN